MRNRPDGADYYLFGVLTTTNNLVPFCGALTAFAYIIRVAAIVPQFKQVLPVDGNPRIICRRRHSKHPCDHGRKACAPVDPVRLREGFQEGRRRDGCWVLMSESICNIPHVKSRLFLLSPGSCDMPGTVISSSASNVVLITPPSSPSSHRGEQETGATVGGIPPFFPPRLRRLPHSKQDLNVSRWRRVANHPMAAIIAKTKALKA